MPARVDKLSCYPWAVYDVAERAFRGGAPGGGRRAGGRGERRGGPGRGGLIICQPLENGTMGLMSGLIHAHRAARRLRHILLPRRRPARQVAPLQVEVYVCVCRNHYFLYSGRKGALALRRSAGGVKRGFGFPLLFSGLIRVDMC